MEINKKSALELMDKIKHAKIDIKKTIEQAYSSDLADYVEMSYCVSCLDDTNFDKNSIVLCIDNDDFYNQVEKYAREDGIFIDLAYVVQMEDTPNEEDDVIIIGENSESDEEDEYVEIVSASKSVYIHDLNDECIADVASSYGIKIKIDGDSCINEFGMFGGSTCQWPSCFDSFEDNNDAFIGLNNIQNQIIVKLMYDVLIFKDN